MKELKFNVYCEAVPSNSTGQKTWNEQITRAEGNLKSLRYQSVCGIQKGGWQEGKRVELEIRGISETIGISLNITHRRKSRECHFLCSNSLK